MTTRTENLNSAAISGQTLASLQQQVRAWVARRALKYRLGQERSLLAEMSDAQLRDIGIDRAEAELEAASNSIPAIRLRLQD